MNGAPARARARSGAAAAPSAAAPSAAAAPSTAAAPSAAAPSTAAARSTPAAPSGPAAPPEPATSSAPSAPATSSAPPAPATSSEPHEPAPGFERDAALRRLAEEQFDVLVVGGGITGVGVALDAASRGLRTALVDKADFGSGTSSKSSKMVHGGLRYLRQRDVGLVYESLAERQRLLENAPHLVRPLPFLIPLLGRDGVVARAVARSYAVALWLYDLTGGLRIGSRHRRVRKDEALARVPALRPDRLVAGFLYLDAHADDARLTLSVLRTAVLDHGAVAASYTSVVELLHDGDGRVAGARVRPAVRPGAGGSFGDAAEGPDFDVRAAVVVNATGVWADDVRLLQEDAEPALLRPAKGVHVMVPADRLPCDIACVVPVKADRRSVFVVPWPEGGRTYIGTTDTDYCGSLDHPSCEPQDVGYLLDAVNAVTTSNLTPADVTGVWAGLRPLLAGADGKRPSERTADLSRRHSVRTSRRGLVTVTGGKLTTYRKMAEDTVDQVLNVLGPAYGVRHCVTRKLRLRGGEDGGGGRGADLMASGGRLEATDHLWWRYGSETPAVLAMADGRPELLEPVVPGLPYLGAEVVHAVRAEMAQSVDDVLSRRTRAIVMDARAAVEAADRVAALMAPELGWTAEQAADQAAHFRQLASADLEAAGIAASLGERP